jgi:hypothetical protein
MMEALIILLLYFLPALWAVKRGHHNAGSIFIINLFLGWTVLAWIVCLAWSFSALKAAANG